MTNAEAYFFLDKADFIRSERTLRDRLLPLIVQKIGHINDVYDHFCCLGAKGCGQRRPERYELSRDEFKKVKAISSGEASPAKAGVGDKDVGLLPEFRMDEYDNEDMDGSDLEEMDEDDESGNESEGELDAPKEVYDSKRVWMTLMKCWRQVVLFWLWMQTVKTKTQKTTKFARRIHYRHRQDTGRREFPFGSAINDGGRHFIRPSRHSTT